MGRICCQCGNIIGDYEWEFEEQLDLCEHGEEEYIYIDDWLLPVVVLLNKKGYDILYAISPNMSDGGNKFVIEFEESRTYNMELPPDGFYWKDDRRLVSKFISEESYDDRIKDIASHDMLLLEWANKLEDKSAKLLN